MNIWERYESIVNVEEIKEASENTFEKPKAGEHIVKLMAIEPSETKTGSPIAKFKFRDKLTNKLIVHNMFLSNTNYPDRTADVIVSVMNFAYAVTGVELKFVSMSKLADDLSVLNTTADIKILVTYKNEDSKYPTIEVLERIDNNFGSTEMSETEI